MSRFHIEDIVDQDKDGIVFRAHDKDLGRTVSLCRFLPFGRDGGGLEQDEAEAYRCASENLASVSHAALRSIIVGSVDPIDGIPYLATEWLDGISLDQFLAGESMEPALVANLLRDALEVSLTLSETLGEEAIWVETEMRSIILGSKESGRGNTFQISPFKWLGAHIGSKKLSSIAELGEQVAGWKGKTIGDRTGNGLGGWIKWLRGNPDARLSEALQLLNSFISTGTPAPRPEQTHHTPITFPSLSTHTSSRKNLYIATTLILLTGAGAFFYLQRSKVEPQTAEVENRTLTPANVSQESTKPLSSAQQASARAAELKAAMVEQSKIPVTSGPAPGIVAASTPDPKEAPDEIDRIFTRDDKKVWVTKKTGEPVKLGGIVQSVQFSTTGKSIYLHFSEFPDSEKLAGVAHISQFKGVFSEETFKPFVGKNVVLTGTCFKEPNGRVLAKIRDTDDIQVAE